MKNMPSSSTPCRAVTLAVQRDMNRRLRRGRMATNLRDSVFPLISKHDHIGYKRMDLSRKLARKTEGFTSGRRGQDRTALSFEKHRSQF